MTSHTRRASKSTFGNQPLVLVTLVPEQLLTAVSGPLPVIAF
jgi:hypothetical protein